MVRAVRRRGGQDQEADKIKKDEMVRILAQVREALAKHPAAYPELVVTSSDKGVGIETLRSIIAGIAG